RSRARNPRSAISRFTPAERHARRHLLHTAMVVGPFITAHLFSPVADTMKQLGLLPFQVVQKPSLSSFQVPSPLRPAFPTGWRRTLPSGVNTILNLMFESVDEVNGWPLKKVAWISFGASRPAASPATTVVARAPAAMPAIAARMMFLPGREAPP